MNPFASPKSKSGHAGAPPRQSSSHNAAGIGTLKQQSSLVACPVCSKSIPEWFMNNHLDNECTGMEHVAEAMSTKRKHVDIEDEIPNPLHDPIGHNPDKQVRTGEERAPYSNTSIQQSWRDMTKQAVLRSIPLAERARPKTLDDFIGQKELIGPGGLLRTLVLQDSVPSIILWGPCGVGKTTLARIIARSTKAAFKEMGATTHGVADLKKAFEDAKNLFNMTRQRTIIFLDEIHRFTKAQQDVFLPFVERGTITLIGATTENPSFRVNAALLSRCRVLTLDKLSHEDGMDLMIKRGARIKWLDILDLALREMSGEEANELETIVGKDEASLNNWVDSKIEEGAIKWLIDLSDGDGRSALNTLEIALQALSSEILEDSTPVPTLDQMNGIEPKNGKAILARLISCKLTASSVKTAFQKTHLQYDRQGDEHYNLISALHKSIRGGDADASLYWLGRMLVAGEDPLYIARRLIRLASEDIGLADSTALPLATATYQACQMIGMPECEVNLAHCVAYMARASKSIEVYHAYNLVKKTVQEEYAYPVPIHLRNASTGLMKDLGYGAEYKYNPGYAPGTVIKQEYLPKGLEQRKFFGQIQYMTLEEQN